MPHKPRFRGTAALKKKKGAANTPKNTAADKVGKPNGPGPPAPERVPTTVLETSWSPQKNLPRSYTSTDMEHCWTPSRNVASRGTRLSRLGLQQSSGASSPVAEQDAEGVEDEHMTAVVEPESKIKPDRSLRWESAAKASEASHHRSRRLREPSPTRQMQKKLENQISSQDGPLSPGWDSDDEGSNISEEFSIRHLTQQSTSSVPRLPKVQAVRNTTRKEPGDWSADYAMTRNKWMAARDNFELQKGTAADRLRKATSAKLRNKVKVMPMPQLSASWDPGQKLSDVQEVQMMLTTDTSGRSQWDRRNNYLESWCQAQGIKPQFEAYGPEDLGALDAIWDSIPEEMKDILDREEAIDVLLPGSDDTIIVKDGSQSNRWNTVDSALASTNALPRSMTPQKRPIDMARPGKVTLLPSLVENLQEEPGELVPQAIAVTSQDLERLTRRISEDKQVMQLSHYLYGHDQIYTVNHLLTVHTGLTRLELANNDLRDSEVQLLAATLKELSCDLKELDLSDNWLTYHSCAALLPLLRNKPVKSANSRSIRQGVMSTNNSVGSVALMRLSRNDQNSSFSAGANLPLKRTPVLTDLNLSGNPIGNKAMELIQLNIIGHGVHLKKLNLSNCKITTTGATYLGEFIGGNKTVDELLIGWNVLGAKGCRCIVDAVQGNTALKILDLSWCGLGEAGGSAIVGVLKSNKTLMKIILTGNNLGDLSAVELGNALKSNRSLKYIVLHHNPIGWQGARKLLQAAQNEHVKAIELCNCHLQRRPRGAAEFDPNYPWGIYRLDLSNPSERVVAVQLAEVCYSADRTEPGNSIWIQATVDGSKFKLSLVEPKQTKIVEEGDEQEAKPKTAMKDFNLPATGVLKFELKQKRLSTINKGETPVTDSVLEAMWNKSISADIAMSDEWKLSLLDVLCADYYFTVDQLISFLGAFEFPGEQVRAVAKVFARLVDPSHFQRVEHLLTPSSQATLQSILGVNRKYHPMNPTGHYDLVLSSQVDNMIAWRLLNEFKDQTRKGFCQLNDIDYWLRCWVNPILDGHILKITNPDDFHLPSEGLLSLCFLDLRPPKPSSKVLPEFNFRALLGYLAEAKELDSDFMTKFLNDEDLIYKAERVYRLSAAALKGDALAHMQITLRDKMNAVVVLRQVLAEIWLTCDQISRLVAVCNKSGFVGPVIAVEVAVMLWSRCIERSEWNIVMNKLNKKSQVKVGQTIGYGAIVNPRSPDMHYCLRMYRSDELHVAQVLHERACKLKGLEPYRNCSIFYPDEDGDNENDGEWLTLSEALSSKVREWSVGMKAVWEAFVNGIRDEKAKIPTTIEYDFHVDTEEEEKNAARFVQRAWRAWQDFKHFQNLQLSVTRLKLCMTKRVLRTVISTVRSNEENKLYDAQNPDVAAYLEEMEMMRKEASAAIRLLQMDPFDLLKKIDWSRQGSMQEAAASAEATAAPPATLLGSKSTPKLHVMHEIQEKSVALPQAADPRSPKRLSLRRRSTFIKTKRDLSIISVIRTGGNVPKVLKMVRMRLGVTSLCKADLLKQVEAAAMLGFKASTSSLVT